MTLLRLTLVVLTLLLGACAGNGSQDSTTADAVLPAAPHSPYTLRMSRPHGARDMHYESAVFAADIAFMSELGQTHNGIRITLTNRSDDSQVLDWELAKIINVKGYTSEVTFFPSYAEKPGKNEIARQKVRLAPGQTLTQTIYPVREFVQTASGHHVAGSLLPVSDQSLHGQKLGLLLTLDSSDGRRYLSFEFMIVDARAG